MKSAYASQVPFDLMTKEQLELHRKITEEFDLMGEDELGELACAILMGGHSLQSHVQKLRAQTFSK